MARLLTLALFCAAVHAQAVSFLSLRNPTAPDSKVAALDDWQLGQLPDSLWIDSAESFVVNPLAHLQPETLEAFTQRLAGKRVLVLIHGMAKTLQTAQKDFFNGLWSWKQAGGEVDEVLLVSWPGTQAVSIGGFVHANPLARRTGKAMTLLFEQLNKAGCELHVVTHSMGSKVALKALKSGSEIRGLYLMAPSVLQWSVRPGRRWARGVRAVQSVPLVFYSRSDWALNFTMLNRAGLGHNGVRISKPDWLVQIDCTQRVNQRAFQSLARSFFRVRSNHSMYWHVVPVFEEVAARVKVQ